MNTADVHGVSSYTIWSGKPVLHPTAHYFISVTSMHSDLNFVTALVRLILERAHASILGARGLDFFFFSFFLFRCLPRRDAFRARMERK